MPYVRLYNNNNAKQCLRISSILMLRVFMRETFVLFRRLSSFSFLFNWTCRFARFCFRLRETIYGDVREHLHLHAALLKHTHFMYVYANNPSIRMYMQRFGVHCRRSPRTVTDKEIVIANLYRFDNFHFASMVYANDSIAYRFITIK